jgi:hypothetical protein
MGLAAEAGAFEGFVCRRCAAPRALPFAGIANPRSARSGSPQLNYTHHYCHARARERPAHPHLAPLLRFFRPLSLPLPPVSSQGEGGILHADTFKSRWFVLARVPHATVLIYYDRKCMDEDHILGFIDMRKVIAIRDGSKVVTFDGSRSAVSGLVHKMRGFMGAFSSAPKEEPKALKPVLELVTSNRVYTLCPCTGESPGPVPMAAAAGPSIYGKPLYLFGWPFPVPQLEGAVMSSGDAEDGEEDEAALAMSDTEAMQAANAMLSASDPWAVSRSIGSRRTRPRDGGETEGKEGVCVTPCFVIACASQYVRPASSSSSFASSFSPRSSSPSPCGSRG